MTSLSEIVTIEDVSVALGTSPAKVKNLCRKYEIPIIKVGHKVRMTQASVDQLLEAMTWRYGLSNADATITSKTQFRGVGSQSAYDKLQSELSKQKQEK
jgi:hypothetical protein